MGLIPNWLKPVKVHTHDIPRCGNDPSCHGRGKRIVCRVMLKGDKRFCVCVHVKIG